MVVGVDLVWDATLKGSCAALVASVNSQFTRYFSTAQLQSVGKDFVEVLPALLSRAFEYVLHFSFHSYFLILRILF